MPYLLMPRASRGSLRRSLAQVLTRAAVGISNVAAEFAAPKPSPAVEPAGLLAADELPPAEEIAAAASAFAKAAEQARAADRGKRAARKLLDRLPVGLYGGWSVEREPSGRQTVDLDAVRRIFKQHGLGAVPMKSAAPTLKVSRVVPAAAPLDGEFAALAAALKVPAGVAR